MPTVPSLPHGAQVWAAGPGAARGSRDAEMLGIVSLHKWALLRLPLSHHLPGTEAGALTISVATAVVALKAVSCYRNVNVDVLGGEMLMKMEPALFVC